MTSSPTMSSPSTSKRPLLNKFLTKTYHCISECDPSIACWSSGGTSFTIKDVDAFEKIVLPKYFNHSRFDSFIRQLNFYSFHKSRSDPDLQCISKAVRYSHEYFRQGHPELLQKIQRTTACRGAMSGSDISASERIQALQEQISRLQQQVETLEKRAVENIQAESIRIEARYSARIQNIETLLAMILPPAHGRFSIPPPTAVHRETAASLADLADYIRSNPTKTSNGFQTR